MKRIAGFLAVFLLHVLSPHVHATTDLDRPLSAWIDEHRALFTVDERALDERSVAIYKDWRTLAARDAMADGLLRNLNSFWGKEGVKRFRTMMTAFGLPTDLNENQLAEFERNPRDRTFTFILSLDAAHAIPIETLHAAGIYHVADAVRVLRRARGRWAASVPLNEDELTILKSAVEEHLGTPLDEIDLLDGETPAAVTFARQCDEVLRAVSTEELVAELHRRLVPKKE